jgi:hypothetical protein
LIKKYFPPRPKGLPKGYDSWPEHRLHHGLLKDEMYHPPRVPYVTEHKYEPDFLIKHKKKTYLLEFKGYFRDGPEASKYTWIRKALPKDHELIFVFDKPSKPIHFRAKRTDGTKQTHAEWATKNNFRYFDEESFTEYYKELKDE